MELGTTVEGIGHLLSDRLLSIPDYQREYSWDEDEVTELWNDLAGAIKAGVSEYFLGSLVTTRTEGNPRQQVIDGQQRLATVSLLYAVLRDVFASRSDERAGDIERELLFKQNMKSRAREPRLVLNAEDNPIFRQLTIERVDVREVNPQQESHHKMVWAFNFFASKFDALIAGKGAGDWQAPLLEWYEFVLEKALVIEVSVSDESRAFVIFETLNDRGLNLSTSDLLKNHLFGTADDRLEEAKVRWTRAMSPFSNTNSLNRDTFLRHFWASQRGVVRVKALYSSIRPEIDTPAKAVELADSLATCGPLWAAMYDRDADFWKGYSAGALGALDTLGNLSVEQCRPLLLAGLRIFPKKEVEALLSYIVSWTIRWFVVGGGSAGVTERRYADAAKDVTDGQLTTAEAVRKEHFLDAVPNDLQFEAAFGALTVRRGWLARYYLTALERAQLGQAEPELVPNQNVDEVNLEHILPRNAVPVDWPAFSADDLQNMVLMLGNQALLRKTHNTQIGNSSFAVKKPVLEASDLYYTKDAGAKTDWTPEVVIARQKDMAKLAVKVWAK